METTTKGLIFALLVTVCWLGSSELSRAAALPSCIPPAREAVKSVVIESKDREGEAVSVTAHLLKPRGDGPFPAVVVLHASGGFQPGYLCIAEKIVSWGYVALVIDSNSAPSRNREQSLGSFLATEQAQDAHQGRTFLMALPYIQGDRVGVIGWSSGGRATLAAVSSNKSFYNGKLYGVDKDGAFAAAIAVYPICYDELKDLDAPVLILIGANDRQVSAKYCESMSRVGRTDHDVELKVHPDTEHGFDGPWSGWTRSGNAASDARLRIRQFLAKHVR